MDIKITMKAARVNANLTVKEAANALGVAEQTLLNWESGKTSPSIAKARELAEVYSFPLECISLPF